MASVTLDSFELGMDTRKLPAVAKPGTFMRLRNCFVTPSGTLRKRPGFRKLGQLDAASQGLFANHGMLHAFYADGQLPTQVDFGDASLLYHALRAPPGDDVTYSLVRVWADWLYLGKQYVVAEFMPPMVRHFWLSDPGNWLPNHAYNVDAIVQPTTPNGYYYKVGNTAFPQAWQAGKAYTLGDVVVPTILNGWKYTLIDAVGDNPSSGSTEPAWPTQDGATVTEEHDGAPPPAQPPQLPPFNPGGDRYGNLGAGRPGGIRGTQNGALEP